MSEQLLPAQNAETPENVIKQPTKHGDIPWYRDPPKVAGVLAFVLSLGTLGERILVRNQEQTQQRLQQLREVTGRLADIQAEYLTALAAAPSNIYALGVAKNTKRQMYLQTAAALLDDGSVKQLASPQIFAALASEVMTDGRYAAAKQYFSDALKVLPDTDEATRPFILRALGQLHRIPATEFVDPKLSTDYFAQALAIFDKRGDDTGHLSWAETVLSEASLEVTYGDPSRAKDLANQALARLKRVRTISPFRTQLERLAGAFERGEQFAQTQEGYAPNPVSPPDAKLPRPADAAAMQGQSSPNATVEIWTPIPGQISGAEIELSIDGVNVGPLSNLTPKRQLALPPVSPGIHKFTFANVRAYLVDPSKGPSLASSGFSCGGLFESPAPGATLRANIGSGPAGVLCALQ
jgi:tetratricopeptide (TPR) repeat protein